MLLVSSLSFCQTTQNFYFPNTLMFHASHVTDPQSKSYTFWSWTLNNKSQNHFVCPPSQKKLNFIKRMMHFETTARWRQKVKCSHSRRSINDYLNYYFTVDQLNTFIPNQKLPVDLWSLFKNQQKFSFKKCGVNQVWINK